MKYNAGASLFFGAFAEELLPELGTREAVCLVAPNEDSLHPDDLEATARALAVRHAERMEEPVWAKRRDLDIALSYERPLIIDLRHDENHLNKQQVDSLSRRLDVVVLSSGARQFGLRSIELSKSNINVYFAASKAFNNLLKIIEYDGLAVEIVSRFVARGFRAACSDFELFSAQETEKGWSDWQLETFFRSISQSWWFAGSRISPDRIRAWSEQFRALGAFEGAIDILRFIHKSGYISKYEVSESLNRVMSTELSDDSVYHILSIQPPGKSEHLLLYELRLAASVAPVFHEASNFEGTLVCFDDVVGSGDTIVGALFEESGSVPRGALENWLSEGNRKVLVLCAIASQFGIDRIEGDARGRGKIKVVADRVLDRNGGIFGDPVSTVFSSADVENRFQRAAAMVGRQLWPAHPLGWNECRWAIVTDYNTPDCSLPVLWASDRDLPWEALFPRR